MRWPWSPKQNDREQFPVNIMEAFGYDIDRVNRTANTLWDRIRGIVNYYRSISCPCAFPRFVETAGFDGIRDGGSCYCSETEAFIQIARECFTCEPIHADGEVVRERWTCITCGSAFIYGWSDFSVHVSRSYLKLELMKAVPVGASTLGTRRVHLGVFGHAYPLGLRGTIEVVDLGSLEEYLKELAPTTQAQ